MAFAPSFFQALEVGLLFGQVCLGPPFAESQKMGDLGLCITRAGAFGAAVCAEKLSDECTINAY